MRTVNWIALLLVVIGALDLGMIGFFKFDVITKVFSEPFARIIFAVIGIAGLWTITFFKHIKACDFRYNHVRRKTDRNEK